MLVMIIGRIKLMPMVLGRNAYQLLIQVLRCVVGRRSMPMLKDRRLGLMLLCIERVWKVSYY